MSKKSESLEYVVIHQINPDSNCNCCPEIKGHRFSFKLQGEGQISDMINRYVSTHDMDGKKVKITIEVIE